MLMCPSKIHKITRNTLLKKLSFKESQSVSRACKIVQEGETFTCSSVGGVAWGRPCVAVLQALLLASWHCSSFGLLRLLWRRRTGPQSHTLASPAWSLSFNYLRVGIDQVSVTLCPCAGSVPCLGRFQLRLNLYRSSVELPLLRSPTPFRVCAVLPSRHALSVYLCPIPLKRAHWPVLTNN